MSVGLIILGAGGHARVLVDALRAAKAHILGVTAPQAPTTSLPGGVEYLGDDAIIHQYPADEVLLVNGIGSTEDLTARFSIYQQWTELGYRFDGVTHPAATISNSASIAAGAQILAGAIIGPGAIIGENTIINSGSIIEHDCRIDAHVHIAPGCVICGDCDISGHTHIGAGSTVIQGTLIGEACCVGAGSLVLHELSPNSRAYGVPARSVSNTPDHPIVASRR